MMNRHARCAFTLLELLLAIGILALAMVVAFTTFGIVTTAWRKGTTLADEVHHGDFAMEQLVMGLRSAHYPDAKAMSSPYGFWMEDESAGEHPSDTISWVKQGSALVGSDPSLAGGPHRVVFSVEDDDEGGRAACVKAWRLQGQPEDFDPEEDVETETLSRRVLGFNCRAAYEKKEKEIDWLDEWEDTNRLPVYVELTLYLAPLSEGEDPVEVKRAIEIPVAPLSWGTAIPQGEGPEEGEAATPTGETATGRKTDTGRGGEDSGKTEPGVRPTGSGSEGAPQFPTLTK
jgi:prepilin-type N-terminal cleavage/methylation domain-containing protein